MASNQELELLPEIQEAEFFSSDATISPPPTTTTPSFEVPVGHLERCNSCGSWKKRSTSPLSSLPQTLLRRSASDPSGSDFHAEVTTATPPRPQAARNESRSPSYAPGSADLRRWRRMKRREKEIRQWNEEFAQEEDKDEQTCYGILETSQNDLRIKHEEAVWAEKKGEDLVLHFKCPCRKEYEIYMSGTKCYYRVI